MKVREARKLLDMYDGDADVQICVLNEDGQGRYYDVQSISPLIGGPKQDAIFDLGEFRCG